jgi:ClpP class serine protease
MPPKRSKKQLFGVTGLLAIRPSALSFFWLWGGGTPNERIGPAEVVTISGPLEQRSCWWDGYDAIVERFRDALASDADTIVLRIDSPGGECAGCFDAVAKMQSLAGDSGKRVVAFADEAAYSAAYALACVAGEIYLPRAGGVGSIGVIATMRDYAVNNEMHGVNAVVIYEGDRKADGHPDIPISDDAIAAVKSDVSELAGMFRETVSGARGISTDAIAALEAATFMGEESIAAGLADGVMSFDELIAMLRNDEGAGVTAQKEKTEAMPPKKKNAKATGISAAQAVANGANDLLSVPQVAPQDPAAFAAIAKVLGEGAPKGLASLTVAPAMSDEPADDDEDEEDAGTSTTTTTTTETTTEDGGDEEEEDEEDDEEDGDESAIAPTVAPSAAAAAPTGKKTSGHVLAFVRELTGQTSPGAQIGALTALQQQAATVAEANRAAAKAARVSKKQALIGIVDKAISAGQLAPSQRKWAIGAGLDVVNGYLATAPKALVKRAETRPAKVTTQSPAASVGGFESTGKADLDASIATVAAACQQDPKAVAEHARQLISRGFIH